MADAQISVPQVVAAPSTYLVADAAEFILKCVNADFDGSGSAASWLPCVTIKSDSGHVVARAVDPSVVVAAGGSAEVSFFPGVKHAPAASGGGALSWAASAGDITLPSGANASVGSTQARVATNDAATFDLAFGELNIKVQGLYLAFGSIHGTSGAIAAAQEYELSVDFDTLSLDWSQLRIGGTFENTGHRTGIAGTFAWTLDQVKLFNIHAAAVPAGLVLSANSFQAAGSTMACAANIGAIRISDAIAGSIA